MAGTVQRGRTPPLGRTELAQHKNTTQHGKNSNRSHFPHGTPYDTHRNLCALWDAYACAAAGGGAKASTTHDAKARHNERDPRCLRASQFTYTSNMGKKAGGRGAAAASPSRAQLQGGEFYAECATALEATPRPELAAGSA